MDTTPQGGQTRRSGVVSRRRTACYDAAEGPEPPNVMPDSLPCLILTGASGIVGRSFLPAAQNRFRIYAIARRPQQKAAVPRHPNIHWLQVDIGNQEALATVMSHIHERGGADYVLHLAAHYDFDNVELADYQHTNVNGTRHMLEESKKMGISHFIFASSVAACEFPGGGSGHHGADPPRRRLSLCSQQEGR